VGEVGQDDDVLLKSQISSVFSRLESIRHTLPKATHRRHQMAGATACNGQKTPV
jgi:hypothetical protein